MWGEAGVSGVEGLGLSGEDSRTITKVLISVSPHCGETSFTELAQLLPQVELGLDLEGKPITKTGLQ